MRFISQSDLENKDINPLPIRRGCSGPCACMGTCQNIIAYVDREEYETFIKNYVSKQVFLDNYVRQVVDDKCYCQVCKKHTVHTKQSSSPSNEHSFLIWVCDECKTHDAWRNYEVVKNE